MKVRFRAPGGIGGRLVPPPDKSITHRALILAGAADGTSRIHNPLLTGDCRSTRACLEALGVGIEELRRHSAAGPRATGGREAREGGAVQVTGRGLRGFTEPAGVLDAGNSGTTARLLSGMLAGQRLYAVLSGDDSLRRRPMLRVVEPLRRMGADIRGRDEGRALPLSFIPGPGTLRGGEHRLEVPSAQVKSALLLAALRAEGPTRLNGALESRDHTERLFDFLGLSLERQGGGLVLNPGPGIPAFELAVPGDLSSAAFFITAALISGRRLEVRRCGLNPSRSGFLRVLLRMGAELEIEEEGRSGGEAYGSISISPSALHAVTVEPEEIPALIDEIPLLAVLGLFAEGTLRVRGAEELRHKESDRLEAVESLLSAVGGVLSLRNDGFELGGPQRTHGGVVEPRGDHRIAMAAAALGAGVAAGVTVEGFEAAGVSFPGFLSAYRSLGGEVG